MTQRQQMTKDDTTQSGRDFAEVLAERSEYSVGAVLRRALLGSNEANVARRELLRRHLLRAADEGETYCTVDFINLCNLSLPLHNVTLRTLADSDAREHALHFVAHETLGCSKRLKVRIVDSELSSERQQDDSQRRLDIDFDWSSLRSIDECELLQSSSTSLEQHQQHTTDVCPLTNNSRHDATVLSATRSTAHSIGVIPRNNGHGSSSAVAARNTLPFDVGANRINESPQTAASRADKVHYF